MRSVLTVRRSWSAAGCHRYLCAALQWCESPQAPLLHFCISEQSQSSSVHIDRPGPGPLAARPSGPEDTFSTRLISQKLCTRIARGIASARCLLYCRVNRVLTTQVASSLWTSPSCCLDVWRTAAVPYARTSNLTTPGQRFR